MEEKQHNLLVYLLAVISEACNKIETVTDDLCEARFWDGITFKFDNEDIEVIKSLSKHKPCLRELLKMIEAAKR